MPSPFDASEFEDGDLRPAPQRSFATTASVAVVPGAGEVQRPPSREEVDARVTEMQQRLSDLRRAQETLERERASLEEVRRRQIEFETGRREVLEQLTRGIGLLEEAEFAARRDAEQMARTLLEFREALAKVQAIREELWTQENYGVELTRALTAIDNGRMEWNAARIKFPVLSQAPGSVGTVGGEGEAPDLFRGRSLGEMCRIGLAFTWPLALVALLALGVLLALVLRK